MDLRVGSSGFSYDFWKGSFYPEEIDGEAMLPFYAASFSTVEINNTFYRMPKREVLARWAACVPAHFRFVIKASRRITHDNKLRDTADNISYLYRQLEALGDKLGCVLFQCPPNLRKDVELLRSFLAGLPADAAVVLELRHRSWADAEVEEVLRARGACLCASDEDRSDPPLSATAPFGYLRLRGEQYGDDALRGWIGALARVFPRAYVFFKHEETAPASIERMMALAADPPADPARTDV
ncbi:MAG TPA: DUF72 domain-containing protein [Nannocystaceae bacterium]|nr:DUF72 domain-containing protein [Nannocystaceae bacterium]